MAEGKTIDETGEIAEILRQTRSIAVVGMKQPGQGPAHAVPQYLESHGYEIFPVNPRIDSELLGRQPFGDVDEIDVPVDLVLLFRRSEAIPGHVDEILAMKHQPRVVWMQSGIRNAAAAKQLNEAGIDVVQDRCMMVDHRRLS